MRPLELSPRRVDAGGDAAAPPASATDESGRESPRLERPGTSARAPTAAPSGRAPAEAAMNAAKSSTAVEGAGGGGGEPADWAADATDEPAAPRVPAATDAPAATAATASTAAPEATADAAATDDAAATPVGADGVPVRRGPAFWLDLAALRSTRVGLDLRAGVAARDPRRDADDSAAASGDDSSSPNAAKSASNPLAGCGRSRSASSRSRPGRWSPTGGTVKAGPDSTRGSTGPACGVEVAGCAVRRGRSACDSAASRWGTGVDTAGVDAAGVGSAGCVGAAAGYVGVTAAGDLKRSSKLGWTAGDACG